MPEYVFEVKQRREMLQHITEEFITEKQTEINLEIQNIILILPPTCMG